MLTLVKFNIKVRRSETSETMAAGVILGETQREALKNMKVARCLDPLEVLVMEVENSPEIFSKIVDQITASSVGPSVLVMLKAGEVVKTKEDRLWPSYKFIRKSGGAQNQNILAQVLFNLQVQELQGKERP